MDSILKAYNNLSTFPGTSALLQSLRQHADKVYPVIFTNGTNDMVSTSISESPDLGPHAAIFKDVITVEEVGKFKPSPDVYYHLAEKVGKERDPEGIKEIWLISGNPFDVVGAKAMGMKAVWVDRAGSGWVDRLVEGSRGSPDIVVRSLDEVVGKVLGASR